MRVFGQFPAMLCLATGGVLIHAQAALPLSPPPAMASSQAPQTPQAPPAAEGGAPARGAQPPPAPPPSQASIDAAAKVLAAARIALGGEAKQTVVKTFVATGRTRRVSGENLVPVEFEIDVELPDKYVRKDEIPARESEPSSSGFNADSLIQIPPPAAPPAAPAGGQAAPAGRAAGCRPRRSSGPGRSWRRTVRPWSRRRSADDSGATTGNAAPDAGDGAQTGLREVDARDVRGILQQLSTDVQCGRTGGGAAGQGGCHRRQGPGQFLNAAVRHERHAFADHAELDHARDAAEPRDARRRVRPSLRHCRPGPSWSKGPPRRRPGPRRKIRTRTRRPSRRSGRRRWPAGRSRTACTTRTTATPTACSSHSSCASRSATTRSKRPRSIGSGSTRRSTRRSLNR